MSTQHQEFPQLTQQAQAAYRAGCLAGSFAATPPANIDRRYLSAFLLEAINQATDRNGILLVSGLQDIAANLHTPPPPLPTREQMEQALQSLIDQYGARVAGEWTDAHLQTLSAGIAHYCKVQP